MDKKIRLFAYFLVGGLFAGLMWGWAVDPLFFPSDIESYGESAPPLEGKPSIDRALTCRKITAAVEIQRLEDRGFEVDFRNGIWYLDDEVVGYADEEDSPFWMCSTERI